LTTLTVSRLTRTTGATRRTIATDCGAGATGRFDEWCVVLA
jgi:hypothetical protein